MLCCKEIYGVGERFLIVINACCELDKDFIHRDTDSGVSLVCMK